jgi:hypothetical protein
MLLNSGISRHDIHYRSLSWLGTDALIKSGGVKLSNVIKFVYCFPDTAVALFHDFPRMVQHHYSWTFGIELCLVFEYTQQISLFASTYILVALSVDRLLAIITPLSPRRRNRWYRRILIFIPWFLAAIFGLPNLKSVVAPYCGDLENEVKLWCIVDFRGQYGIVSICI